MKKIITLAMVLMVSAMVFGQNVTEIKQTQLPKATQDYIKTNLKGAVITKCAKMEDKGVVKYAVGFDMKGRKHIVIFDKNGNFLEKGDKIWSDSKTDPKKQSGTEPVKK